MHARKITDIKPIDLENMLIEGESQNIKNKEEKNSH